MDPALKAKMEEWLASGDPVLQAHARHRLSTAGEAMPVEPTQPQIVRPSYYRPHPSPSMLARINTCPYRECRTGCQRTVCHAGKGDRFEADSWGLVTLQDCEGCMRGEG